MKATKHRHGHRWTTEELRSLMLAWENDEQETISEIAARLGTTESAVLHMVVRLRRDGVPLRRRRRGHKPGRHCQLWTQQEVEYLFRARLAHRSVEEIAHELGRTERSVAAMISTLRKNDIPVAMLGNGVRRLWDPNALKGAVAGRFNEERVNLAAQLDEGAAVQ